MARFAYALIAMLFVSISVPKDVIAVENASWGEIKSISAQNDESDSPAGKMVKSANKAVGLAENRVGGYFRQGHQNNSSLTVQRMFVSYGNNMYSFTLNDPDGISEFRIDKANDGGYVSVGSPKNGNPPCPTSVHSGTLTFQPSDFPLVGVVYDCGSSSVAQGVQVKMPAEPNTEDVWVEMNLGMYDRSQDHPTGTVGQAGVRIGSFSVFIPAGNTIKSFGLAARLGISNYALWDVFQNITLRDACNGMYISTGDVVRSQTLRDGTVKTQFSLTESFYVFLQQSIGVGFPLAVDVYADIRSDASAEAIELVNSLENGVVVPIVVYENRYGESVTTWNFIDMQKVYIE